MYNIFDNASNNISCIKPHVLDQAIITSVKHGISCVSFISIDTEAISNSLISETVLNIIARKSLSFSLIWDDIVLVEEKDECGAIKKSTGFILYPRYV